MWLLHERCGDLATSTAVDILDRSPAATTDAKLANAMTSPDLEWFIDVH